MHPALFLEEILRVIFVHCDAQRRSLFPSEYRHRTADLVALARTCQVFKEPALDVLWMNLKDLTPLLRCLPAAICMKCSEFESDHPIYMFKRVLETTELDTVKKYSRRVRTLIITRPALACVDRKSLADLCRASITGSLFPNIRRLYFYITDETLPLIRHVAVPNLRWLDFSIGVSNLSSCKGFIHSLGSSCPNLKMIGITSFGGQSLTAFDDIINQHIRRWTHLQAVDCSGVSLDLDTLFHLSRMPSLTELSFTLGPALTDQSSSSDHVLVFSALQKMRITIGSNIPISGLFTRMRLPTVSVIHARFHDTSPPRHIIRSFLMALQEAGAHGFSLTVSPTCLMVPTRSTDIQNLEHSMLILEDVHPITALNLSDIHINLHWIVDLKDSDLLQLAYGCQRLTSLVINDQFGWGTTGITPAGLAQFLRQCPLLHDFCIALDTRGYYVHPPRSIQSSGRNPVSRLSVVNVADSVIEEASVPALAAFFADLVPLDGQLSMISWGTSWMMRRRQDWKVYSKRWQDVYTLANQESLKRSLRWADEHRRASSSSEGSGKSRACITL